MELKMKSGRAELVVVLLQALRHIVVLRPAHPAKCPLWLAEDGGSATGAC